ncbi:glycosyltransferase family 4 protein [Clostridium lacusfryxellense]|uniref:glycosyltransferase family 4 protein n=1 Tax=Clostridium lacusfryxellense TaxID=205328 RepID=UPI001C0D94DF|nr:glycosyltransferase family 4 protein [Clostridium lacusfryxellense]MBU3112414.1 glycosyltransferase family 4 protein [Clostridium lacusfryxellense]
MKIAIICTEKLAFPPVNGGAVQMYLEGALPILSKFHEITVFSIQDPKLPNRDLLSGVKYIRLPSSTTDEYVRGVKNYLTNDFNLVHVFNRPRWVPFLSKDLTCSFSLSLHNEMFPVKKISSSMANACIDRVSFITTVSQFIANGVKELYPSAEGKLHPVYSAVDCNIYNPIWLGDKDSQRTDLRAKYGLQNYKTVLYVGRLTPKKGTHIVLDAMNSIMMSHPNTALMIIGSKWYGGNQPTDYIRLLKKFSENLIGPVIFTGFLNPSEIPNYYSIGDIFVNMSQWREPLARVHYEAMAAGLPIITTNRGGNAEVMVEGVNGFIMNDYDNPRVLEKNIVRLLDNEDLALTIGKNGRKLALEKYSFERLADDLLKLFDSVK